MIVAGLFVSAAAAPTAAFARRTFLNGRQFFRLIFRGLFRFFRFRRRSGVRFNADNAFYPVIRREQKGIVRFQKDFNIIFRFDFMQIITFVIQNIQSRCRRNRHTQFAETAFQTFFFQNVQRMN